MSGIGRLRCQCFSGSTIQPVGKARVTVTDPQTKKEQVLYTNTVGTTEEIELETPDMSASQSPGNVPYYLYDVKVEREGFNPLQINGAQVYPNRVAIQKCNLEFLDNTRATTVNVIDILANTLVGNFPPKIPEDPIKPLPKPSGTVVLPEPVVPQFVVVHSGTPNDTSAPNYTLPYADYIKNVASSEIFSTWPNSTIRANIYCIISFTLNRIYTEWYRGKGKNFDITNSTAYDQAFVYGRTIYDNISAVVDQIFSTFVQRPNEKQPLLTQYCNGTTVTCPDWLSQWGSKYLGDQGNSPYEILTHYFGDNLNLVTAPKVQGIPQSFPGYILKLGYNNIYVRRLQEYLNSISNNYPLIQKVAVDGNFGPATANAVKTYQQIFNLPQTGEVDYATWYSISNTYVAVNKLAELTRSMLTDNYEEDENGIFCPPVINDLVKNVPIVKY